MACPSFPPYRSLSLVLEGGTPRYRFRRTSQMNLELARAEVPSTYGDTSPVTSSTGLAPLSRGIYGLYPVAILTVSRDRYPYPLVKIREYLTCFLTEFTAVNSTGIPSVTRVELSILSHDTGRVDRLGWYHRRPVPTENHR